MYTVKLENGQEVKVIADKVRDTGQWVIFYQNDEIVARFTVREVARWHEDEP